MTRKTFSLGDHFEEFIDSQVSEGRYDNASEVVRAALRLLEDHEARMRELRAELAQADAEIARGEGVTVTDPKALAETVIGKGRARLDRKRS
jgi:antitoxin ParD1/3/4